MLEQNDHDQSDDPYDPDQASHGHGDHHQDPGHLGVSLALQHVARLVCLLRLQRKPKQMKDAALPAGNQDKTGIGQRAPPPPLPLLIRTNLFLTLICPKHKQ